MKQTSKKDAFTTTSEEHDECLHSSSSSAAEANLAANQDNGFTTTSEVENESLLPWLKKAIQSNTPQAFTTTSEKHDERSCSSSSNDVEAKARSLLSGFTLIELLVVISIIGLLSSVVIASLSGARESAQVTRLATDMKQLETAMTLWMDRSGRNQWPGNSSDFPRNLNDFHSRTTLSESLPTVPTPPTGDYYIYDFNGGVMQFPCGGFSAWGVNIIARDITEERILQVDQIIDGGEESDPLDCGRVRLYTDGSGVPFLIYSISADGNL